VRRSIGYVSQTGAAFSGARAGDEVVDHGMLYGLPRRVVEQRGKELFQRMNLDGLWTRTPRNMSGGQKRRLDVVMGLIHEPQLMFLDEPTTGLDPQARANLWDHIRDLRDRLGVTVLLTTHYLDEADALSDRIVVIDHGKIVASDTANNLKDRVAGDLVDLELVDPTRIPDAVERLGRLVTDRSGVEVTDHHVRARVRQAGRSIQGLIRDLDTAQIELRTIEVHRPTLDDVFLSLTGRSLRDAEAAAPGADPDGGTPTTVPPVPAGTATGTPTATTTTTTTTTTTDQGALR
jgi:ABC-2 type transport system ATP-binding protein